MAKLHRRSSAVFLLGCVLLAAQYSDDEKARLSKLYAYAESGDSAGFVEQTLWFVENHPEIITGLRAQFNPLGGLLKSPADYERVKAAWEVQLSQHPYSVPVLLNAAQFLQFTDLPRAIDLAEQTRRIASNSTAYIGIEAVFYATVFTSTQDGKPFPPLSDSVKEELRQRVLNATDPALLNATGRLLMKDQDLETRKTGLELLERAVSLDPTNPGWQSSANAAKNGGMPADAVRIGAAVAEANLIQKVDPVYPALAKSARVSGTVEFTVVISKQGSIENMQLVRGHPLLVNAAREAVLQWKYRPTLLNGVPIQVMTKVTVNFTLPDLPE